MIELAAQAWSVIGWGVSDSGSLTCSAGISPSSSPSLSTQSSAATVDQGWRRIGLLMG